MQLSLFLESFSNDINSKYFKLQSVFDRYIHDLEQFKKFGFTYEKIRVLLNEQLESEIAKRHYSNLIYRSKAKIKNLPHIENESISLKNNSSDKNQWSTKSGIILSSRQINEFEYLGYNLSTFSILDDSHDLSSTLKINKLLTDLKTKKRYEES